LGVLNAEVILKVREPGSVFRRLFARLWRPPEGFPQTLIQGGLKETLLSGFVPALPGLRCCGQR
jgi:hypothetical protein